MFSYFNHGAPIPSRESAERWIAAGLIQFGRVDTALEFNRSFPGIFQSEPGARAFSRFLPGSPDFPAPDALSPRDPHELAAEAMVECGCLHRLALPYAKADRHGFNRGLIARVDREARRARQGLPQLDSLDPAYPKILAWANERLRSGQDRFYDDEPLRSADFYDAFFERALLLCQLALDASSIAEAAASPHRSARPPRL